MSDSAQQDAVALLQEQHDTIRQLFTQVANSTGEARRDAFEPLIRLLAVHETAEEMVVYPAIEKESDEAARIAEARKQEEDQAKKELTDLEKLDLDSAEFEQLLQQIQAAVEQHASAEEREVFPLVAATKDAEERRRMAESLVLAQSMAPTHPHKTAPESALGNLVMGPFVAMIDRARDAFRDARR